jgi:hypothetical protein
MNDRYYQKYKIGSPRYQHNNCHHKDGSAKHKLSISDRQERTYGNFQRWWFGWLKQIDKPTILRPS